MLSPVSVLPGLIIALLFLVPLTERPHAERDSDTAVREMAIDSVQIHRDARSAQEDFERFRETRIPAERRMGGRPCDEPMGRLCLMYPREGEESPPIASAPR
ncbi:MAG: hypothetical protein EA351_05660, partial [Gemmatimonadales bacterium]